MSQAERTLMGERHTQVWAGLTLACSPYTVLQFCNQPEGHHRVRLWTVDDVHVRWTTMLLYSRRLGKKTTDADDNNDHQ